MSRKVLLSILAAAVLVLAGGCILQESGLLTGIFPGAERKYAREGTGDSATEENPGWLKELTGGKGSGVTGQKVCKKQLFAMDTYMEFTAYGEKCEQAVDAAMEEVKRLDGLLSTGSSSSEVSRLNAAGSLEVSEDTAALFRTGKELFEETGGLFDFTIYPVMKLWGFPTKEFRVPGEGELQEALSLVDASRVEIQAENEESAELKTDGSGENAQTAAGESGEESVKEKEDAEKNGIRVALGAGQQVDFGGIAKGYTSARVMEIFREYGIESGLVSLGGNIQTLGTKPDGSRWNIGIRDPEGGQSDYIAVASVSDCAVVTSGGYERYFEENGKRYIHIIDPRTGRPVEGDLTSVTIFSADGTLADALSTSLYIMGLDAAVSWWQENGDDFEFALLTDTDECYLSEGVSEDFRTDAETHVVKREAEP